MKELKLFHKLMLLLFLPTGVLMSYAAAFIPNTVENIYSDNIYKSVSQTISLFTGLLPISIGEFTVIALIVFIIWKLIHTIIKSVKNPRKKTQIIAAFLVNILLLISLIYFGFVIIWGLNYHRLPFANIAGLNVKPASVKELEEVCVDLINRSNKLRGIVDQNSKGVMDISGGHPDVFNRVSKGYENAARIYPELGGKYGKPKGVILSTAMSYAGISGVYFPFTAEANVNIDIPDSMLPSTASHEVAHQRGFAREDEANYIAYLTCSVHPDADFQYSGTLLALINSMNALYGQSPELYMELSKGYSDGVRRDLSDLSDFWNSYEGPVEKISEKVNDTYLKANGLNDGVQSYGRMGDLLIAEYRLKTSK